MGISCPTDSTFTITVGKIPPQLSLFVIVLRHDSFTISLSDIVSEQEKFVVYSIRFP